MVPTKVPTVPTTTYISSGSLDTDTNKDMRSEKWLLTHGHWQIEAMAHLDEVPATGDLIVVTWPEPKRGLGFPARDLAIVTRSARSLVRQGQPWM